MANHLTELRKKAGFKTAKQLSDKLKISVGMVYQMEGGFKKPSVDLAIKMAKLYNCTLEDIFLPQNTTNSENR